MRFRSLLSLTLLPIAALANAQFYKVAQQNGKWWFVRDGKPLWSYAVDCVDTGDKGKPDNPNYNALALFPSDQAWVLDTLGKFKQWGFNSLGGWCEDDLFTKYSPPGERLPYFMVLHLGAYDKAPWSDLFSPDAEKIDGEAAAKLIPPVKDDPYLVGYYTDNELGWWDDSLFKAYFAFPASAPGKQALIESLRKHYGTIEKLGLDWDTDATSFEELASKTEIYLKPGMNGVDAVHQFNRILADRYYSLMQKLVREYDTNHLILGDRYEQYYNLETVEASKPYVDVVSTNDGADWLDGSYCNFFLNALNEITGKPVIVTEYYMAAMENSTGNKNPGKYFPTVQTQAERAKAFANCTRYFASLPFVIGAQWFQFADEPPKGRGDGEAYNMGLVDVYGHTYQEMVQASAAVHPTQVHGSSFSPTYSTAIPTAPADPMKDTLNWDRLAGLVKAASGIPIADLYVCSDTDDVYVAVRTMEFIDESLYKDGKLPAQDRPLLRLSVGNWKGEVRFNGKDQKAVCSDPHVQLAEEGGLKYMIILKLPLSVTGTVDKTSIHGELFSHGRGYKMSW